MPGYKLETVAELSVIQFIEICKWLKLNPVPQAEMVEVKRDASNQPPPMSQPPDRGRVETNHETTSPTNVAELAAMLSGK